MLWLFLRKTIEENDQFGFNLRISQNTIAKNIQSKAATNKTANKIPRLIPNKACHFRGAGFFVTLKLVWLSTFVAFKNKSAISKFLSLRKIILNRKKRGFNVEKISVMKKWKKNLDNVNFIIQSALRFWIWILYNEKF